VKPKLLIIQLWQLGDLVLATPFIRAAAEKFEVTLLAKPFAFDLQPRLWPQIEIIPFVSPWTAFTGKYRLHRWPWRALFGLREKLARGGFDIGISARWDPRDHFLLWFAGVPRRIGFGRLKSGALLTDPLAKPDPREHQYEFWRVIGCRLNLTLPARASIPLPPSRANGGVLVHSGAGQPVRVWPLSRYRELVERLRKNNFPVMIACDPDQRDWWLQAGERDVATPRTVTELLALIDRASALVGNDSGPGHLATFCGVPALTIFGPQLPEWFAPLHPKTVSIEGHACPYKPCSDYCRFPEPHCLTDMSVDEVWENFQSFLRRLPNQPEATSG
jgi:ADP-heptose:LPS heptosyltransferase